MTLFDVGTLMRKAADARPPIAGATYAMATATTATRVEIPSALMNSMATFQPDANMYIVFGGSTVVADPTATSGATRAKLMLAGQEYSWHLASQDAITHFSVIAASGTPILRFWKSSH